MFIRLFTGFSRIGEAYKVWCLKHRLGAYFDYASLTPHDPRTYNRLALPLNPSALHTYGVDAQKMVAEARATIATALGLSKTAGTTLTFTASGTEANNMALFGVCEHLYMQGRAWNDMHIITSVGEHSSILEPINILKAKGVHVTMIPLNGQGTIDVEAVVAAFQNHTVLISLQLVNNETGAVQPIEAVAKAVRRFYKEKEAPMPIVHTDAAQASCMHIHIPTLGVDILTLDMGKLYGPRGMGILYINPLVRVEKRVQPYMYGGGQEKGLRSGTENVPAIIEAAQTCALWQRMRGNDATHARTLRSAMIEGVTRLFPQAIVIEAERQSPHILNIALPGIDAEVLALRLDAHGIYVSTKSSCLRDAPSSYVLTAMKHPAPQSALRISFGRFSTRAQVEKFLQLLPTLAGLSAL